MPCLQGRTGQARQDVGGQAAMEKQACGLTKTNETNNDTKQLDELLRWLLFKKTQTEMPGGGRSFRKRTARFWAL